MQFSQQQGFMPLLESAEASLEGLVTVVLTTSPVPQHPSTFMLETTLTSCRQHAAALYACHKIIVCDGFNIKSGNEEGRKARKSFRSGA